MWIVHQVEDIRSREHARLRSALQDATQALGKLREAQQVAFDSAGAGVDMWGDPITAGGSLHRVHDEEEEARREALRRLNLVPLEMAWRPLEDRLLERVDCWEMDLRPLVHQWAAGEPVTQAVQTVASSILARRTKCDPYMREVRAAVSFVGPLRSPVMRVLSAIEAADEAESEVVPALIAGQMAPAERTMEPTFTRLSSEDIARKLRNTPRPAPAREHQPDTDEQGGFFRSLGRLFDWVRRG